MRIFYYFFPLLLISSLLTYNSIHCFNCVAPFLSEISPSKDVEWGKQGSVMKEATTTTMGTSVGNTVVSAINLTLMDQDNKITLPALFFF